MKLIQVARLRDFKKDMFDFFYYYLSLYIFSSYVFFLKIMIFIEKFKKVFFFINIMLC